MTKQKLYEYTVIRRLTDGMLEHTVIEAIDADHARTEVEAEADLGGVCISVVRGYGVLPQGKGQA